MCLNFLHRKFRCTKLHLDMNLNIHSKFTPTRGNSFQGCSCPSLLPCSSEGELQPPPDAIPGLVGHTWLRPGLQGVGGNFSGSIAPPLQLWGNWGWFQALESEGSCLCSWAISLTAVRRLGIAKLFRVSVCPTLMSKLPCVNLASLLSVQRLLHAQS